MYILWHSYSPALVSSFFSFLIFFGVFFVFNLFLAVISNSFEKENQKEKARAKKALESILKMKS